MPTLDLLIGTHNLLLESSLAFGDLEEKEPITITTKVLDEGHFGGVATTENPEVFYAARRLWYQGTMEGCFENLAGDSFIHRYESDKRGEKVLQQPLYSVHAIRSGHGGLYVVETGRNQVLWISLEEECLLGRMFDGSLDTNHPNCLSVGEGGFLVLLHNHKAPSQVVWMVREDNALVPEFTLSLPYSGCHGLEAYNDHILYLNSLEGELISLSSEGEEKKVKVGKFAKGLAVSGAVAFVGSNSFAERSDRRWAEGEVVLVDLLNFKEVARFFPLGEETTIGNVNDIRVRRVRDA